MTEDGGQRFCRGCAARSYKMCRTAARNLLSSVLCPLSSASWLRALPAHAADAIAAAGDVIRPVLVTVHYGGFQQDDQFAFLAALAGLTEYGLGQARQTGAVIERCLAHQAADRDDLPVFGTDDAVGLGNGTGSQW